MMEGLGIVVETDSMEVIRMITYKEHDISKLGTAGCGRLCFIVVEPNNASFKNSLVSEYRVMN